MRTIRSVLASLGRSPLKSILTLLTVGLGVGVLVFTLSISSAFARLMKQELEQEGLVVMVANATISESTGQMERVMPPQFDDKVLDALENDVPGVKAVSPIGPGMWNELIASGVTYRIRSVVSADEKYAQIMRLRIVAGTSFTTADVSSGAKVAIISRSLAEIMFKNAESAIGKTLQPPAPQQPSTSSSQTRGPRPFVMPTFTVCGVFEDVGGLARTSYGIGDMIVPYTSTLPQGANIQMAQRNSLSTIALRVQGTSFTTVESQVRQALARQYGEDVSVEVWEGTPFGQTAALQQARDTVNTFSLVVNLLGFVLLVAGSIGILSIMLVEVLGRSREIALERALGAPRSAIAREYLVRSMILSSLAAVVGLVLCLALARPLELLVVPIFTGPNVAELGGSVISPIAAAIGMIAALAIGGLFGVLPVIPALRADIADSMREG